MKKQVKDAKIPISQKKVGRSILEVVPNISNNTGNNFKPPRDNIPLIFNPEEFIKKFNNKLEPFGLFPEWDKIEVSNFDFGENNLENSNLFTDPEKDKIILPPSIINECNNDLKWMRNMHIIQNGCLLFSK